MFWLLLLFCYYSYHYRLLLLLQCNYFPFLNTLFLRYFQSLCYILFIIIVFFEFCIIIVIIIVHLGQVWIEKKSLFSYFSRVARIPNVIDVIDLKRLEANWGELRCGCTTQWPRRDLQFKYKIVTINGMNAVIWNLPVSVQSTADSPFDSSNREHLPS